MPYIYTALYDWNLVRSGHNRLPSVTLFFCHNSYFIYPLSIPGTRAVDDWAVKCLAQRPR